MRQRMGLEYALTTFPYSSIAVVSMSCVPCSSHTLPRCQIPVILTSRCLEYPVATPVPRVRFYVDVTVLYLQVVVSPPNTARRPQIRFFRSQRYFPISLPFSVVLFPLHTCLAVSLVVAWLRYGYAFVHAATVFRDVLT